jgi:uncharacterized LabA/DUF88 family protein
VAGTGRGPGCKAGIFIYLKMSDINIASHLFELAFQNAYDKALIFSGDSDLVPAIQTVRRCFPDKKIIVIFPKNRGSIDLKHICEMTLEMKKHHYLDAQLEDVVYNGNIGYRRPPKWR